MPWEVRVAKVATLGHVPGPEVFWMGRFGEWLPLDINVGLALNGTRTVLINTGPPLDLVAQMNQVWHEELGPPSCLEPVHPDAIKGVLREWDIGPEDVTDVVLTPLQAYAVGGVDQFPQADIWISRRGWVDLLAPPRFDPRRRMAVPDRLLRYLLEDAWFERRVHLLADEDEIADGVRVWWAGTHHRSSIAIEIAGADGLVTFTDTVFYYENLETDWPLGIQESMEECHETYARLRKSGARVVSTYDPSTLDRYPGGRISPAGGAPT
jgi:glyoxylase-like metal-dependent hydrolase (beta-lactamase superfamily II)